MTGHYTRSGDVSENKQLRKSGHDRDVFASSRCLSFCVHARSTLSNIHCTGAFNVHARSTLAYVHCTHPLHAVVRSLYTPTSRCRTFTVHSHSTLSYVHCTRPLHVVVRSLYTSAPRGRTFTVHTRSYMHAPRCRLLVVTVPSVVPQCLPSASPVTDLIVCV